MVTSVNRIGLFIYTGSIGLESIVSGLSSIDLIGDLNSIKVRTLSEKDAGKMLNKLMEELEFELTEKAIGYLLKRTEWLIPFHIQIFLQETGFICIDDGKVKATKELVDRAFDQMLDHRNHFEHWQVRLRKAFKSKLVNYKFAEDVLNTAASKRTITSNEIFNLAVKRGLEDGYKEVIRILLHDGYINNNDNPQIYRFNSPILKSWWYKNVTH